MKADELIISKRTHKHGFTTAEIGQKLGKIFASGFLEKRTGEGKIGAKYRIIGKADGAFFTAIYEKTKKGKLLLSFRRSSDWEKAYYRREK